MRTAEKISQLQKLLERAEHIEIRDSDDPTFKAWKHSVERTLIRVFGEGSTEVAHFETLRFFFRPTLSYLGDDYSREHREVFERDLEVILSSIRTYIEDFEDHDSESGSSPERESSSNVFIIHGRDFDFAEVVARFLEKRGLTPVILHEEPNQGRTIIEKFEEHAMPCAFAIALFTPDDEGRLRDGGKELHPRARQNVVLELGYFVGALGRSNVAVLHEESVELPSDYDGVLYIPKNEAWKAKLGQELDAAGVGIIDAPVASAAVDSRSS